MIRRRRHFVAPFVLVVGCSGAGTVPPVPPPLRPEPLPIDAAIDAAIDAPAEPAIDAPADAEVVTVTPDAACLDPRDPRCLPRYPRCGGPPDPSQVGCNPRPPDAVEARIIKLERTGADYLIGVGVGADGVVDKRWSAVLLDEGGRIVKAARLVIIRVDRRVIYLRVTGIDSLPTTARVRLSPP